MRKIIQFNTFTSNSWKVRSFQIFDETLTPPPPPPTLPPPIAVITLQCTGPHCVDYDNVCPINVGHKIKVSRCLFMDEGEICLFYSILFYSILLRYILFYSILFYSILFYFPVQSTARMSWAWSLVAPSATTPSRPAPAMIPLMSGPGMPGMQHLVARRGIAQNGRQRCRWRLLGQLQLWSHQLRAQECQVYEHLVEARHGVWMMHSSPGFESLPGALYGEHTIVRSPIELSTIEKEAKMLLNNLQWV